MVFKRTDPKEDEFGCKDSLNAKVVKGAVVKLVAESCYSSIQS